MSNENHALPLIERWLNENKEKTNISPTEINNKLIEFFSMQGLSPKNKKKRQDVYDELIHLARMHGLDPQKDDYMKHVKNETYQDEFSGLIEPARTVEESIIKVALFTEVKIDEIPAPTGPAEATRDEIEIPLSRSPVTPEAEAPVVTGSTASPVSLSNLSLQVMEPFGIELKNINQLRKTPGITTGQKQALLYLSLTLHSEEETLHPENTVGISMDEFAAKFEVFQTNCNTAINKAEAAFAENRPFWDKHVVPILNKIIDCINQFTKAIGLTGSWQPFKITPTPVETEWKAIKEKLQAIKNPAGDSNDAPIPPTNQT